MCNYNNLYYICNVYNCNYLKYIYNNCIMSQLFPKLYDFTMFIFLVK